MLEADVVERQRVLQDNILRLKLMTTPIRQDWADVCAIPAAANRHTDFGEKDHNWVRYYVRLFQNKKLVCWLSQVVSSPSTRHVPIPCTPRIRHAAATPPPRRRHVSHSVSTTCTPRVAEPR